MKFLIASHGHCFDGLASAVIFLRAIRRSALGLSPDAELEYAALGYGPRQTRPETLTLSFEKLAILDYRYSARSELSYYFDHHRTAFANSEERADFERRQKAEPERYAYDEAVSSCTKLLAEHLIKWEGLELGDLAELIAWADTVDAARFQDAHSASDYNNPVLRLVSVVEQYGDAAFFRRAAPLLESSSLLDFCRSDLIEERYGSIYPHQRRYFDLVKTRGVLGARVAYVDLSEDTIHAVSKFAVYAEFPRALYSVVLARQKSALRISVGYNPWCGMAREHDIGTMCAEHGGGGHPVVGGIAFQLNELDRARTIARGLAKTLETEVAPP
jgi:hypothetical protein